LISAIFGAIAGHISSKITYSRDRRQKEIDDLEDLVIDLQNVSVEYWEIEGDSVRLKSIERKINSLIKRVNSKVRIIFDANRVIWRPFGKSKQQEYTVKDYHKRFYREITGGAFEVSGRKPDSGRTGRIEDIGLRFVEELKKL
jgi:hypothetical protein